MSNQLNEALFVDQLEEEVNRRQRKILSKRLNLKTIKPLTENQKKAFSFYYNQQNLILRGTAGTGKTYLSLYFALRELQSAHIKKVYLIRSAVSSRDVGFLPGSLQEKTAILEGPFIDIVNNLSNNTSAYHALKEDKYVEFMSTSYIRGLNIDDSIIIVDEAQNCTFHELNSILTRIGENTRVFLCGDIAQNDLNMLKNKQKTGLDTMTLIASTMPEFGVVEFDVDDIVRSGFLRNYILAKTELGIF